MTERLTLAERLMQVVKSQEAAAPEVAAPEVAAPEVKVEDNRMRIVSFVARHPYRVAAGVVAMLGALYLLPLSNNGDATVTPSAPTASAEVTADAAPKLPPAPVAVPPAVIAPKVAKGEAGHFEIGDKLKLMFYERVENVEANKWDKNASTGFQQRPELSGEYAIDDDGLLSLPLLGSFPVVNQTAQSLQAALVASFEGWIGRKGFVTIMSLERPPVYILGPVKSPGKFAYVPGMTVYHAISLAGGFEKQTGEAWQQIEAVRESSKRRNTFESMADSLTRLAVLKAERDHVAAQAPDRLVEIVGETKAGRMIAVETERRASIVASRANRERAAAATVAAAKAELQALQTQNQPLDNVVKLRQTRMDAVSALLKIGNVNNNYAIQVQAELSDVLARRQDAVIQVNRAKQQANLLEEEQAKVEADVRADLDNAIGTIEQQVTAGERDNETSEGILGTLKVAYKPAAATGPQIEIVRQSANGTPTTIAAQGTTMLRPGDLVRIVESQSSADQPGGDIPTPATGPRDASLPNDKETLFKQFVAWSAATKK